MDIDLVSGRRELNLAELKAQEREEQATWGPMKRYTMTKSDSNELGCTFGFAKYGGTLNSAVISLLGSNVYVAVSLTCIIQQLGCAIKQRHIHLRVNALANFVTIRRVSFNSFVIL